QQIVRDFRDQPAAVQAQKRIAELQPPAPPSTMIFRKIELGAGVQDVVATDGRRAVYWDAAKTFVIGDVAGKDERGIYKATTRIPRAVVSRDLSMVFFYFPGSQQEREGYAVIKTDRTGYRDLALFSNDGVASQPSCMSWSWDNRYLLMCKPRTDGMHLLKI